MISMLLLLFLSIFAWVWEQSASVLSCDSGSLGILLLFFFMHWDTSTRVGYGSALVSVHLLVNGLAYIDTTMRSDSNEVSRMTYARLLRASLLGPQEHRNGT